MTAHAQQRVTIHTDSAHSMRFGSLSHGGGVSGCVAARKGLAAPGAPPPT